MTAATDRAALLRALADHLDAHPHLPLVSVTGARPAWLQIHDRSGAAVAAWARSFGVDTVIAEQHAGTDYTRLIVPEAILAGQRVELWGTTSPPLQVWHGAQVPVSDLEGAG